MKYIQTILEGFQENVFNRNSIVNFLTKLSLLIIFSFCLYVLNFPIWKPITVFLFISSIAWVREKTRLFSIINFFMWFTTGSFLITSLGPKNNNSFSWPVELQNLQVLDSINVNVSFVIIAIFFFGIYALLYKAIEHYKVNQPVWLSFIVLIVLYALYFNQKDNQYVNWILFGVILGYSKAFWMMIYQFSERDFLKKHTLLDHFATISPPWQQTWAKYSVVRGFSEFLNNRISNEKEFILNQISAVRLAVWAILLNAIGQYSYEIIFKSYSYKDFQFNLSYYLNQEFSLSNLLNGSLGIGWSWFFIISNCFIFLLYLAATTHTVVAVARMSGFRVQKNFNEPYKASSFNNFMYRIYYYYISILMRVFYFPLWSKLRWIEHKKTRIFLVSFLTITLGGLVDTVLKSTYLSLHSDFTTTLSLLANRSLYFISIAFFAGFSAIASIGKKQKNSVYKQILMVTIYFVLYSLSFFMQIGGGTAHTFQKIDVLFRVFGF